MVAKEQVIDLVEQGQAEMLQFAAALTEEDRNRSGAPEGWAARDVLAHMAFWKQNLAERLSAVREGRSLPDGDDYQHTNEAVFEQYRGAAWSEIETLLRDSHRRLLEQLDALAEEELNIPGHFAGMGEGPLWRSIVGNAFSHPVMHIAGVLIERGEQALANALRAREETLVSAMDSSPDWQALNRYNLACHWALSGEPQKAIDLLAFAFQHRPDLIEWAPQDSDLASLHNTSAFQELIDQARREQKTS